MDLITFLTKKFDNLSDNELAAMTEYVGDEGGDSLTNFYSPIGEALGANGCENGVSKFVFWYNNYPDIVIKIPFCGEVDIPDDILDDLNIGYDDNEKYDELFDNYNFLDREQDEFYPFYRANSSTEFDNGKKDDYCDIESRIYDELPEDIREMFCRTSFLFDYESPTGRVSFPVYISDKASHNFSYGYHKTYVSNESRTKSKEIYDEHKYVFDSVILDIFVEQYGELKVEKLYSFLDKYGISDFHDGNLMFNKDNKIVIIDYSDYKEG